MASDLDSQVTVASAATLSQQHSPVSRGELLPASDSQPLWIAETAAATSTTAPQPPDSDDCIRVYEPPTLKEVDPASLQDSQESTVSALALETRANAFQAILASAKGKIGLEIGLLSTTDNHSKLDEELTFAKHMT